MDKQQYLEAIQTFKTAVKEIGPANRASKTFYRQEASYRDRGLPFEGLRPRKISRDQSLRATLLCMILAGSRGRLHCRFTGRGDDRQEMTLALQTATIENAIVSEEKYERNFEKYIKDGTWAPPDLSANERALARELIDDFGRRRHSGVGEDDRDGSGSAPEVAAAG